MESAVDGAWPGTGVHAGQRAGDIRVGVRPGWLEEVPRKCVFKEGQPLLWTGSVPGHPPGAAFPAPVQLFATRNTSF